MNGDKVILFPFLRMCQIWGLMEVSAVIIALKLV